MTQYLALFLGCCSLRMPNLAPSNWETVLPNICWHVIFTEFYLGKFQTLYISFFMVTEVLTYQLSVMMFILSSFLVSWNIVITFLTLHKDFYLFFLLYFRFEYQYSV